MRIGIGADHAGFDMKAALAIGVATAIELCRAFLSAVFTGEERHVRRVRKVEALEARRLSDDADGADATQMNAIPRRQGSCTLG